MHGLTKKSLKCQFLTWIYLSYRPVTFCNFCILWFNPVYLDVPVIIPGSKERFLISILRHFLESWVPRWASWVRSPPGVWSPAGFRTVPVLVTPTGRVVIAWLLFWGSSPLLLCSSWHIFLTVGGKVLDFQRHFVFLYWSLLYFWHLSETICLIFNVLFLCQARNVGQVLFTRQWLYQGRRAGHTLITRGILFYLQQVCFFTTAVHWPDSFPSFSLSTSVLRPITAASYLFPLLLHDWVSAVYLLQSRETTASTLYRFVFVALRDLFSPDDLSPSHLGNLSQMDFEDFSAISFFLFWVFSASHAAFSALAIWLKLSLCASLKTGLPSSPAPPPACWAQALAGSAPAVGPDSCCCWCDARGVNNYQPEICY